MKSEEIRDAALFETWMEAGLGKFVTKLVKEINQRVPDDKKVTADELKPVVRDAIMSARRQREAELK